MDHLLGYRVEDNCHRGISKLGNSGRKYKPALASGRSQSLDCSVNEPGLTYRTLARLAERLLPLGRPFSAKLARGDRERRAALERWEAWGRESRDPARPLLWLHAASVGEGLQAIAVAEAVRARHPDWQIAATFFSPSAEALVGRHPADRVDYLPYDTGPNAARMFRALRPAALVFTKLDLWPGYAVRARAAGIPVGMVAGTVSPVSGRRHPVARWIGRAGYQALDRAGAIADADARALTELGAPPDRITVTGDPRFDSALTRAAALPPDWPWRRLTSGGPALVAGSTWPADEAVLLEAFARIRREQPGSRLVLVPHEPADAHLADLEQRARGLGPVRLSALGPDPAELVIVDRVGLLAGLYAGAALSYVGGGFGRAGLHSVLEPAACGVGVLVGPRWQSSREAGLLLEAGGAVAVRDAAEVATAWARALTPGGRRMGEQARAVIESGLGAADRNARLIEELVDA